jgi:hypothetical protein
MSPKRVDTVLKEIDAPYEKNRELREARSEFAAAVRDRLPSGSRVFTPTIERTDAGRAQAKAVSPTDADVAIDVELDIWLPTTARFPGGIRFKPDGIRFMRKGKYMFLEHKEVLTIWNKSHYSREFARREIEIMLRQRADIYLDLQSRGCVGFQFSSNNNVLSDVIADAVSDVGGPGRQGLLAPILRPRYRKSDAD